MIIREEVLHKIDTLADAILLFCLGVIVWVTDHTSELTGFLLFIGAAAKAYVSVKEAIKK